LHAGLGFAQDYPTYGPMFRSLISIDPSLAIAGLQHEMIQPQQQWLDNLQITFRRSIKIINRYFQEVLLAVAELQHEMIQPQQYMSGLTLYLNL
jgi:hypothetical protein